MFRVKNSITKEQEELIIHLYQNELMGQEVVSKKVFGKSCPQEVKKILKKYDVHIRTQKEACIISNKKRAIEKNEDYFSIQSSNMAWLLGFLASDGSICANSNAIRIGLASIDKEILEKIKIELGLATTVKEYINSQGYSCVHLQWTCEQHKKDLATYGIIPAKTFCLKPPLKLEKKYWIDYIRGYFDGDGSVNLIQNSNHKGNGNLRWQIYSASKDILEFILNHFETEFGIPKVNIYESNRSKNPLYYIQYSSTATRKIYSILYTNGSLYLQRKKDHFDEVVHFVKPLDKK